MQMLDIILEFGEHYYNGSDKSLLLQLVFSFIGPLLGFGTALIFYYKKIKNDTKIDKEKMLNATNSEKQKLQFEYKNRIKYFNLIVSDIINKSKEQNENILKNIIEQKKDLLNTRVFKTISTSSFKRLYSTDNKGVFEAYYHEFDNRNTEWIYIYNDRVRL